MEYKYTGNYYEFKENEWLMEEEGFKLSFSNCKAAEVLVENFNLTVTGWIIEGEIEVLADAISHTKKGAIGKVIRSSLNHCLLLDGNNPLAEQIDLGAATPLTDEQKASFDEFLEQYDSKLDCKEINNKSFLDENKWDLLLVSNKEVYVLAKKALVIARGDEKEVFVKYSGIKDGAHVFVDKGNVNVNVGKFNLEVEQDGKNVLINGKDPREYVNKVISKITKSLVFNL